MKWEISNSDYDKIRKGVWDSFTNVFQNISKTEPQIVAGLVWHLTKSINTIKLSQETSAKAGGVFIHSQPFVKAPMINNKESVELGDLLLLRNEIIDDDIINRRALLLQVKKINKLPFKPDNETQHRLYFEWPMFEYTRSGHKLNGKKRHITGKNIHNATQFLLVLKDFTNKDLLLKCLRSCNFHSNERKCLWVAQPTFPVISNYRCFYQELVDFIIGDAGKEFIIPHTSTRNWDRVIKDLVETTAQHASIYIKRASKEELSTRGLLNQIFFCGEFSKSLPDLSIYNKTDLQLDSSFEGNLIDNTISSKLDVSEFNGGLSILEFSFNKSKQ